MYGWFYMTQRYLLEQVIKAEALYSLFKPVRADPGGGKGVVLWGRNLPPPPSFWGTLKLHKERKEC